MKTIKNITTTALVGILTFVFSGCEKAVDVPPPTTFKYGYGGKLQRYRVADTAEAYSGDTLVGKAQAVELQDSPDGGPRVLKIEVTHFTATGEQVYKGFVFIQAGFDGGTLVKEENISGKKKFTIFREWQFNR